MKKIISLILILSIGLIAVAQQKPYYSQYVLNNYILNPAVTGIENYVDMKFSYRNQWTDIDGAPVTSYVTINGPIGKKDKRTTATSLQIPGDNPYKSSALDNYEPASPHHGVGFTLISDKTGYISRTTLGVSYAYHIPVSVTTSLSAGLIAGITNVNLDRSKIVWGSLDPNDPAIGYSNGEITKSMPEFGAGLWLYSRDYFIGASVLNLVPGKLNFVKNDIYGDNFYPHLFLQAGYRFFVSDDISILPSLALQKINPLPVFVHSNVKLQYQNIFWVGAGYRIKDQLSGATAMAGINIGRTFNISYSFNSAVNSKLNTYAGKTHEILIGLNLGKKDDTCPKNIW